ncbi:MAG: lactate utilization protein [Desulfotalea sp.]
MENPTNNYWGIRLRIVQDNLKRNNFDAHVVDSALDAKRLILDKIIPSLSCSSIGFGGSMTLKAEGLYDALCELEYCEIMRSDLATQSPEEKLEVRRQSLLADLLVTGTNALIEDGSLVNLDGIGNRVAALTFGPKHVIVLVGRNKIVPDLGSAMARIKDYAAPINAMRLGMKTACAKTSECVDCLSPARICNTWTIHEKSFPKNRIIVVIVNEELGF